jgi:uncharacterized membrane protein
MSATGSRSPERLVFFSDAVVAIALTLLILPLADAVPEAAAENASPFKLVAENQWKIYSFLISFSVIARMWMSHHRLFERVKAYNRQLMVTNLWWLLTVAVIPFPTEMIGEFDDGRFTAAFYVGTVLAGNICQLAMTVIVRRDPSLTKEGDGIPDRQLFMSAAVTGLLGLALIAAGTIPKVGAFALLLLFLIYPVSWLRDRLTNDAQ